jgi:hypothetical protein
MKSTVSWIAAGTLLLASCRAPRVARNSSAPTRPANLLAPPSSASTTGSIAALPSSAPLAVPCGLSTHPAKVVWKDDELLASFEGSFTLTPSQAKQISGGHEVVIATRVYAFPDPFVAPTSVSARLCTIAYDPWNEVYVVTRHGAGALEKKVPVVKLQRAVDSCLGGPPLAVTNTVTMGSKPSILAVIVDVDPPPALAEDIHARARRGRGYGILTAGEALYGSFTDLFCSAAPPALRFRLPGQFP